MCWKRAELIVAADMIFKFKPFMEMQFTERAGRLFFNAKFTAENKKPARICRTNFLYNLEKIGYN